MKPYTQNRYAYVGNNPINRWDPLGYWEDGDGGLSSQAQNAIRELTYQWEATFLQGLPPPVVRQPYMMLEK